MVIPVSHPANFDCYSPRYSLADIAADLGVPVVVARYSDVGHARNDEIFGLDQTKQWAGFTAAVDLICANGSIIIPNVEGHTALLQWSGRLIANDIRYFTGIPLLDFDGWRVGSIAVLARYKDVDRTGISLRRLGELGRAFAGICPNG